MTTPDPVAQLRQRLIDLVASAPELTEVLRGSVGERYVRCGKENCHCKEGVGHGPVFYLSVSLGVRQTKQIALDVDSVELARRYVRNYVRLQEVLEEISAINRELLAEERVANRRRRRNPGGA